MFSLWSESKSDHINAERRAPSAERRAPSAERRAPSAERQAPRIHLFVLLVLAGGAAVAVGFNLPNRSRSRRTAVDLGTNIPNADVPRHVAPLAPVLFGKDSDAAVCIQRVLRSPQPGPCNLPYCLHLIRLYGWSSIPGPHFTRGRQVLAALTDLASSERYLGEPAFFQTRSGIRYRTLDVASAGGAENHRDVCLATFAEAGLPLSTEFTTPKETFHLRDLLRDSVQNFHLQQEELPWTVIAYALYPSIGSRWTNRFGESFGWDDLTETLLSESFERNSCGGTHLLYALLLILRTDRPLSPSVRTKLEERVKTAIASASTRQAADGHWSTDWCANVASEPAIPKRRIDN